MTTGRINQVAALFSVQRPFGAGQQSGGMREQDFHSTPGTQTKGECFADWRRSALQPAPSPVFAFKPSESFPGTALNLTASMIAHLSVSGQLRGASPLNICSMAAVQRGEAWLMN